MGIISQVWDKVIPVILRGETPYKLTLGRQVAEDLFKAYNQPITLLDQEIIMRVAGADLIVDVDPLAPIDQIYVWIKPPEPQEKVDLEMPPEYKKNTR